MVATDLDGTLLDHFNYSWQAASESINTLKNKNVPIIINTSKTYFEVAELVQELDLSAPFIVENGSAIYVPNDLKEAVVPIEPFDECYSRLVLGSLRDEVVGVVQSLREIHGFKYESYSDWSVSDVVEHTGLDEASAQSSMQRQFSEPLKWLDSDLAYSHFSEEIKKSRLRIIRGGRFVHVLGQSDKGSALLRLKKGLEKQACNYSLVCLGDSHNDLDMLNIADIPVFVRSPIHDFPEHACTNTPIFTEKYGPEGWHEAISIILLNQE